MDPIQNIIEAVVADTPSGKVFRVKAPMQATVLTHDDQYRKKALAGGEEFFFRGARPGKSGRIIFEFDPVDAAPYKQVEFNDGELSKCIESADAWIEGALGMTLAKAKTHFKKKAEQQAAAEEVEATKAYEQSTGWGTW